MEYSDLINKNRLNKLPVHKTPPGVWEKLQTSMFSMNTASLPVYAPPSGTWAGISRSMLIRKRVRIAVILVLLLLGLGTTGYFTHEAFLGTGSGNSEISNQKPAASNQQPAASNQKPATSSQQPATSSQ